MVLPITYLGSTDVGRNFDGGGSWRLTKNRYKQVKPYTVPMPYRRIFNETVSASMAGAVYSYGGAANAWSGIAGTRANIIARPFDHDAPHNLSVRNSARAKFVDKIGASAQTLVNLAERKQASDMMIDKIARLAQAAVFLRRGQLKNAMWAFGLEQPGAAARRVSREIRVKGRSRDFSNLWLESHLGWGPLVQDIYSTCELLSTPIRDKSIRVTKFVPRNEVFNLVDVGGPFGAYRVKYFGRHSGSYLVAMGAKIRINNPNLLLASRLGLTNPASVALELVPFSFIVSWFINLDQFVGQWSDFHGVDIIDPWYSMSGKTSTVGTETFTNSDEPRFNYRLDFATSKSDFERRLGIPSVTLGAHPPWNLSLSRGLTAISLLVQQFIGRK